MPASRVLERYEIHDEIASGGMATVHFGRMHGAVGFSRPVAIKRLHAWHAKDPEFVSMFVDEARLAARIHHPNVVQTLDVVAVADELWLVMEYIAGETLARALHGAKQEGVRIPLEVASAILCGALHGLHSAHEAVDDGGQPLGIVHRDLSPQNIIVGQDGVPRVLDFGVAKAAGRIHTTRDGNVKGKLGYMSPEQIHGKTLDRRSDIFAAGVVLWETLTAERLFSGESDGAVLNRVLELAIEPPSGRVSGIPGRLDGIVLRALERHASKRFDTAREMALALEACVPVASPVAVARWLDEVATDSLSDRARRLGQIGAKTTQSPDVVAATRPPPGTDGSQVSSVTVTTSQHVRSRSVANRRWRLVGAAAVLGIALAVSLMVMPRTDRAAGPATQPAVAQPAPEPPAPVADVPAMPAATESSAPSAVVAATTPRALSAAKRHAPSNHAPPGAAKPCAASYIDDAGIKHYQSCP